MAKSRDKLFIEQGIGEHDVEDAIRHLNLEEDRNFCAIMSQNEKDMRELMKSTD